jgi:hypothetical protein
MKKEKDVTIKLSNSLQITGNINQVIQASKVDKQSRL